MTMTDITNINYKDRNQQDEASNSEDQTRNEQIEEDSNDSDTNTLKSLLIINKAYQEAIDEKLAQLNKLLHKNLHQQVCIFFFVRNFCH
jgi:hypothetical protein